MAKISMLPALLLVIFSSNVEATGLRGQDNRGLLMDAQTREIANNNLIGCFSDNLVNNPSETYSRFELRNCQANLNRGFMAPLGFTEKKSDAQTLEELLSCIGDRMGCAVEVEKETLPQQNETESLLEAPESKLGQDSPYVPLLSCFRAGLNGEEGAIKFEQKAFNCVSRSLTTVDTMLLCIGNSVHCGEEEAEPAPPAEGQPFVAVSEVTAEVAEDEDRDALWESIQEIFHNGAGDDP